MRNPQGSPEIGPGPPTVVPARIVGLPAALLLAALLLAAVLASGAGVAGAAPSPYARVTVTYP